MPGAGRRLSSTLGQEIKKLGVEPLVHLACRDRNRNDVESLLLGLSEADIRNILIISGDYPLSGASGLPKPVFDLDPVTTLELISRLKSLYEAFDIFAGVAFSPLRNLRLSLWGNTISWRKNRDLVPCLL